MHHVIRERASGWMVKAVLWLLVLAFVGTIFLVWGYGKGDREKSIGTVGGIPITQAEYRRYYDSMIRRLREAMGGELSRDMIKQFGVERTAMDGLIMEKLQLIAAKDAGIDVSDDELRYDIENNKEFQQNGRFDKDAYYAVLRANNLAPQDFEKLIRRDLLIRKVSRVVTDSVQATEQEIKDGFIRDNEQLKVRYMVVSPASFSASVKPSEKDVEAFFKKNGVLFTQPEERKVELISVNPETLRPGISVGDDEVKSYYESHKAEFVMEEAIHTRHILLRLPPNAPETAVTETRLRAESLVRDIKSGADFGKLAQKYSQDPGSAKKGGDLGFFARGKMVPEFEKAAFSLANGVVSSPIRSEYGFHIIKAEERREAGPMPYADAAQIIKGKMLDIRSRDIAKKQLSELLADKSGKSFSDLAKEHKMPYISYPVRAGELIKGIGDSDSLVKRISGMKKGEVSGPIDVKGTYYIVKLVDIIPSHPAKLSEVAKEVDAAYRKNEGMVLAAEKVESVISRLRKGDAFALVAKEAGLQVKESGFVQRNGTIEGVPQPGTMINAAFALKESGYDKVHIGDDYYVMSVAERKIPDLTEYDKQRAQVKQSLLTRKRQDAVLAWQAGLRKDAEKNGILKLDKRVQLDQ